MSSLSLVPSAYGTMRVKLHVADVDEGDYFVSPAVNPGQTGPLEFYGYLTPGDYEIPYTLNTPGQWEVTIAKGSSGQTNLISNHSMESATTGWNFNPVFDSLDLGTVAISPDRAVNGTKSLKATLPATSKGTGLFFSVPTTVDTWYVFSISIWVPSGSPDVKIFSLFAADSPKFKDKGVWRRITVPFKASATNSFVGVVSDPGPAGSYYIDAALMEVGTSHAVVPGAMTISKTISPLALTWTKGHLAPDRVTAQYSISPGAEEGVVESSLSIMGSVSGPTWTDPLSINGHQSGEYGYGGLSGGTPITFVGQVYYPGFVLSPASILTLVAPVMPPGITGLAYTKPTATDVLVRWDPVPSAEIYYISVDEGVEFQIPATVNPQHEVSGLEPGTDHKISIQPGWVGSTLRGEIGILHFRSGTFEAVAGPRGPLPNETPSGVHNGAYAIPVSGEYRGHASFAVRLSASVDMAVTAQAVWLDAEGEPMSETELASALVPGGGFQIYRGMTAHVKAPTGAVRWLLQFRMGNPLEPLDPPPIGGKLRVDQIFVPDNGYPIRTPEFFDGDTPGYFWEGDWSRSSSTSGLRQPTNVEHVVTLDEDLSLYWISSSRRITTIDPLDLTV